MDAHLSTHLDPHDHSTWFISTRPQKVSLWQGDKKGRAHCIASHRTAHIYARHIMARASASDVTRGASLAEWLVPGGLKLDFFFDSAKCFCAFPIIQSNPEDSISQKKKGGDKSRPDSPLPERLVRFISLFAFKPAVKVPKPNQTKADFPCIRPPRPRRWGWWCVWFKPRQKSIQDVKKAKARQGKARQDLSSKVHARTPTHTHTRTHADI